MGKKTRIDCSDSFWPPVTLCMSECGYCYARDNAKRFAGYKENDLYSFGNAIPG